MLRRLPALAVVLFLAAAATPAEAQWLSNGFHRMHLVYHRNVAWPKPFVAQDQMATYAPFGPMVANGWRKQTLLGPHHFEEGERLSAAGEEKVRWILTQAPAQHRTVFIERGRTRKQTQARIDAVQRSVAAISENGDLPAVVDTHIISEGRPGQAVYDHLTRFSQKQPDPILPEASGDITSSASQ
jgi:hypothetical protein